MMARLSTLPSSLWDLQIYNEITESIFWFSKIKEHHLHLICRHQANGLLHEDI
jgi:hypothetical protein